MKSLNKRLFSAGAVFLICALFLCGSAYASLLSPSTDFYVADYAGVLSQETRETIIGSNGALETLTGGQVVVATVDDLEGFSPEEYAAQLFDDWGVGNYTEDNGMLLLLAPTEGRACLHRGEGLAEAFDDATRDQLLEDYFWPDFEAGNYDGAVSSLFPQLIAWYESYYGVQILHVEVEAESGFARFAVIFSIVVLVLLVIGLVIFVAMRLDRRRYRNYYYGMGAAAPKYRPYYFFFGGPHRRHKRRR